MNPNQLFWQRLRHYCQNECHTLRGLIDWTILIYILIPFLIFLGINHYLWWQGAPAWAQHFPLPGLLLILIFALINGRVLYFYEPADLLYLKSRTSWLRRLMMCGMTMTFFFDFLITLLVVFYISPLLFISYHLSVLSIIFLGGVLLCGRELIAYIYQILSFSFSGLGLAILQWLIKVSYCIIVLFYFNFSGVSSVSTFLPFCLESATLIWIVLYRLNLKDKLIFDINRELRDAHRLQRFLVGQMGIKTPIISKRQPLFYRKSQGIFRLFNPVNVTAEVFIKGRLRDGRWLLFYWQLAVYCSIAIGVFPGPTFLRILLYIGTTCLFSLWLKNEIMALNDHSLFRVVRVNNQTLSIALKKAFMLLAIPGIILQSVVLGISSFHLLGLLLAALLGALYTLIVTRFMFLFVSKP